MRRRQGEVRAVATWAAFVGHLEFPLLVNDAGRELLLRLREGRAAPGGAAAAGEPGDAGARALLDILEGHGLLESGAGGRGLSPGARLRLRAEEPERGCSRFPFQVLFEVTRACNLRCRYCFVPVSARPGRAELDRSTFASAVEGLLEGGVSSLIISGGEPLVRQETHKDLFWALELCAQSGVSTILFTNGTLLLDHLDGLLRSRVSKVAVSLDVPDAEAFGRVTGRPDLFGAVTAGVRELARAGQRPEVTMVVSRLTYPYVDRMLALAQGLGARWLNLPRVYFAGASRGRGDLGLADADWEALHPRLRAAVGAPPAAPRPGAPPAPASVFGGCKGGRTFCVLHSDGAVSPCVGFLHRRLGQLEGGSLARAWTGPEAQEFRGLAPSCPLRADSYLVDFEARRVRRGRA